MSRRAEAVTSSTARLNASSLALDGLDAPLSLRTNWSAEARTSSSLAGGSKFASTLMFLHISLLPHQQIRVVGLIKWPPTLRRHSTVAILHDTPESATCSLPRCS